jgi:hypothetical protein
MIYQNHKNTKKNINLYFLKLKILKNLALFGYVEIGSRRKVLGLDWSWLKKINFLVY